MIIEIVTGPCTKTLSWSTAYSYISLNIIAFLEKHFFDCFVLDMTVNGRDCGGAQETEKQGCLSVCLNGLINIQKNSC